MKYRVIICGDSTINKNDLAYKQIYDGFKKNVLLQEGIWHTEFLKLIKAILINSFREIYPGV